jgi:hypothetical protein
MKEQGLVLILRKTKFFLRILSVGSYRKQTLKVHE